MHAYLIDAFTDKRFAGNRAGVILGADNLTINEKQKIAAEIYASTSAFVSKSEIADFKVEFFTPTAEIDFCGHDTVATFYLLAALGKIKATESGSELTEDTKAGIIPVKVSVQNGQTLVTMTQRLPRFSTVALQPELIADALNIDLHHLDQRFPLELANTGNWHLMIPIRSLPCLNSLVYDATKLSRVLSELNALSAYLFVPAEGSNFYVRNFLPTVGIPEDPATGSAAGAFGAYLTHQGLFEDGTTNMEIYQGEAMGRPGKIWVTVESEERMVKKIQVSGTAVISFQLSTEPIKALSIR